MNEPKIYTVSELAEMMNISITTTYSYIKTSKLKVKNLGGGKYEVFPERIEKILSQREKAKNHKEREKKKKCKECFYSECFGGEGIGCGYILRTGEPRGCPAIGCTKFKRRAKG